MTIPVIARNHRCFFVGKTQEGKSELARALWIAFHPPRVCIDVKDDLGRKLPGVPTSSDPEAVLEYPTVRLVPPDTDDEGWYDRVYELMFNELDDVVAWLDEGNEVTKPNKAPKKVRKYQLQGEGKGKGHLVCTPRPADVHPMFATQSSHVFIFYLKPGLDRAATAKLTGFRERDLDDILDDPAFPKYGFAYASAADRTLEVYGPSHDSDELTAAIARLSFGADPHDDPGSIWVP